MFIRTAVLALLAAPLAAQAPLPIGTRATGTATHEAPAEFRFTPPSAGVLTVVVRSGDDVSIQVVDQDGQMIPNASADGDNNGSTGLEFLAVPLGRSEPVRVQVQLLSEDEGGGAFTISASFVAEEGFAQPADPDGRPSLAQPLKVGQALEDSVDPTKGDRWDWFAIHATEAMTVTVMTRMAEGEEGDLVLSAYAAGAFGVEVAHSDQDLQGHAGNESLTYSLKAGETLHVKVAALFEGGDVSRYRVSVGRMP